MYMQSVNNFAVYYIWKLMAHCSPAGTEGEKWLCLTPCILPLLKAVTLLSVPCPLLECSHALGCKTFETLPPCHIMWWVVPQRCGTHIRPCQENVLHDTTPMLAVHQLASLLQHTFLSTFTFIM